MKRTIKIGSKSYAFEIPRNAEIGVESSLRLIAKAAKVNFQRKTEWAIDERGEIVSDREGITVATETDRETMTGKAALADIAHQLGELPDLSESGADVLTDVLTENKIDMSSAQFTS